MTAQEQENAFNCFEHLSDENPNKPFDIEMKPLETEWELFESTKRRKKRR